MESYDVVIIGTGAAGLSAALYAGRYRLKTLAIGKEFGGETATAGVIHNYPGAADIDGYDLMKIMREQACGVGSKVIDGEVTEVRRDGGCFLVSAGGKEYPASTIIFALGTKRRRLGLPNEKELTARGVHYCITCDGPLYTGKTIAVVGGGDTSVKGVNLVGEYAKKIYLIVMEKKITAEPINYQHMERLGDKVEILYETQVKEIVGSGKLERLVLSKPLNGSTDLLVDGLFVEIGAMPNVSLAESFGVSLDTYGYIAVDAMMKTNVAGIFAAGDTVNLFGRFKQDITAAAMGAVAATSSYEHVKQNGNVCSVHQRTAALEG